MSNQTMFKKAERKRVWLKIGITGPAGAGKSHSALVLAKGLAQGKPFAAVDTENRSLALYSHLADFFVAELEPPFAPKKCIDAINQATDAGFPVMVIDSQTHFWKHILEDKEKLDRAGGNSFTNWGKVKPQYEELKEAILHAPMHIICCIRAKDEYVLEKNDKGRETPRKVGMGAIAEPGAEFEYTTVFEISMSHDASISKDRTGLFDGEIERITEKTGKRFLDWLDTGGEPVPEPAPTDHRKRFFAITHELGLPPHDVPHKDIYYQVLGKLLGRDLTSLSGLTGPEWHHCTDWLSRVKDGTMNMPAPFKGYLEMKANIADPWSAPVDSEDPKAGTETAPTGIPSPSKTTETSEAPVDDPKPYVLPEFTTDQTEVLKLACKLGKLKWADLMARAATERVSDYETILAWAKEAVPA
jgi:hypothetical protein